MIRRIAVATAMAAVSATVVCGVAQAADNSDDSGNGRTGTSRNGQGLGSNLQRDGFGRYLSDPEQFYYGADDAAPDSSGSSSDDEDSRENDNEWDDSPWDSARGGKGGKAGTNSSHCEMTLGPAMGKKQCSGGTAAHDGADGEARYIP